MLANMHRHFITFSIALFLHACAVNRLAATSAQDPNDPVGKAVDGLATALFQQEQPALNAAVANLPPEAQALIQAAYVALEQAVKKAADAGLDYLTAPEGVDPQNTVNDLASIANILHETIHDPNTIQSVPPSEEQL